MAHHFVTERMISRRRGHDLDHSTAGYPRGATGPKAMTMGPQSRQLLRDGGYGAVPSVTGESACGSRSVKAMLQRCKVERSGGQIGGEQLVQVEWREHGDALEIAVTG